MSHQTKQIGKVAVTDLEILSRACEAVYVEDLGTSLKLDTEKKVAHYYAGDYDCDAAITFARELNDREKRSHYEIALKFEPASEEREGSPAVPAHYGLWADTHASDHGIGDRISRLLQAYRIEELKREGQYVGAVSETAIEDRPGWKRVRVEIPN